MSASDRMPLLLRHRIVLQRPDNTINSFGEPVPGWTEVATVWAEVRPLSGREAEIAKSLRGNVSHSVTLRFDPAWRPDPTWRVAWTTGGFAPSTVRYLNVKAALDMGETHRAWQLVCEEVTNGA